MKIWVWKNCTPIQAYLATTREMTQGELFRKGGPHTVHTKLNGVGMRPVECRFGDELVHNKTVRVLT